MAGCASPSPPLQTHPPGHTRRVVVGFVPIACAAPLLIAHAHGHFQAHGLEVELRKYSGWAELWTAYATGAIDVAHMLTPMTVALNSGLTSAARPTELAFTQNTNGQALTLAERHVGHVKSAADLKGSVIGIPFEFSIHSLLLRDYLVANGVDPDRDVELRLLRPADMVAQLMVGSIDGFVGPEPFNQRALTTGAGRVFVPTKHMWDRHPCCCVAVARDVDPQLRDALVAGLSAGAQWVNAPTHAGEAGGVLSHEKYLNQPAPVIRAALEGSYRTWEGQEILDPTMLRFGDHTQASAIVWMTAQLARWQLGRSPIAATDAAIVSAAQGVLPPEAQRDVRPLSINGLSFSPLRPTSALGCGASAKCESDSAK
ncbi:ABC-type nitrate/sulfonate/bicarbonate transport system, periplasmic component [Corynebacterium uterequi]|uniref:ABC-type nitrate/sulfonate/bicarbonate transport system, periplasmic component n=2 Tax=Corynebacterium uterequi TaxID=1072256 RepID=A0A0G3HHB5_9CORY|nr:ABC-type nitrate/sulfonate/bicarbonate transport system, periplasmic component [Corynebacterium uterequi]